MQDDPIVIVGSARTPMGGLMGDIASLSATQLGSRSIAAALERAGVPADAVDEVFMGNVLPAGLGHGRITDHMFFDGLEDAYEKGELMGRFAERCASHFGFARDAQDDFAETSLRRARKASEDGTFEAEITPITISERKGERTISRDEQSWNADPDKLRTLKPAFDPQGTVTAANASSISDGACALGHPIGASGARILVTLLNALQRHDLRRGVASICIGGGEATAVAVERLE